LQRRLLEEESKRQEEMKSLFEIIQVEPQVFSNFLEDVEYEFNRVDETLKKTDMSTHEVLVDIYQSVHSIKSNAVILGLNSFGNKVHELESKIKALREQEGEVPFNDMLNLTMDLEHLSLEKDGFKTTIEKINSYKTTNSGGQPHPQNMFIDSLARTVSKAAGDMEKKIRFVADGVNNEAVEKGPKRLMKEVVMQLIRNSVVHGIEKPEDRIAKGKNETGTIRLSIKYMDDKIHVRLEDDGGGLNYKKISEKALGLNLIKKEDENNKDVLLKTIFSPGFSTAENEGVHAGRGIGLNLVRDRVREGGGTIKVQTLEGKGTAFNLFFPKTSEA
jgi:two-component system chemotaxis sensor kinase CheA